MKAIFLALWVGLSVAPLGPFQGGRPIPPHDQVTQDDGQIIDCQIPTDLPQLWARPLSATPPNVAVFDDLPMSESCQVVSRAENTESWLEDERWVREE